MWNVALKDGNIISWQYSKMIIAYHLNCNQRCLFERKCMSNKTGILGENCSSNIEGFCPKQRSTVSQVFD